MCIFIERVKHASYRAIRQFIAKFIQRFSVYLFAIVSILHMKIKFRFITTHGNFYRNGTNVTIPFSSMQISFIPDSKRIQSSTMHRTKALNHGHDINFYLTSSDKTHANKQTDNNNICDYT